MWAPQITFGNIFQSQLITSWGKGGQKFNFWFESNTQKMTFSKSMKITLTCDFHFENYVGIDISIVQKCKLIAYLITMIIFQPFDSHLCDFDFGIVGHSNRSVDFDPVQVLPPKGGIKPIVLTKGTVIPNLHLPYSFMMISKNNYGKPLVGYVRPYTGVIIKIYRDKLDQLIGGFFGPMTIFALLSMVSFFINPDVVSFKTLVSLEEAQL